MQKSDGNRRSKSYFINEIYGVYILETVLKSTSCATVIFSSSKIRETPTKRNWQLRLERSIVSRSTGRLRQCSNGESNEDFFEAVRTESFEEFAADATRANEESMGHFKWSGNSWEPQVSFTT
jgi:hypothetical protein